VSAPKVFIVDDEKTIAEALSDFLREAHLDVETFCDPCSALVRASDCPPDVLVSDIDMPEMDGIALANALRDQIPTCKVILMSGNPDWKIHEYLDGAHDFVMLPKPFPLNHLLCLIKSEQS
jgi:two-component system C4-dicarboxylate transport response regulator DctD